MWKCSQVRSACVLDGTCHLYPWYFLPGYLPAQVAVGLVGSTMASTTCWEQNKVGGYFATRYREVRTLAPAPNDSLRRAQQEERQRKRPAGLCDKQKAKIRRFRGGARGRCLCRWEGLESQRTKWMDARPLVAASKQSVSTQRALQGAGLSRRIVRRRELCGAMPVPSGTLALPCRGYLVVVPRPSLVYLLLLPTANST